MSFSSPVSVPSSNSNNVHVARVNNTRVQGNIVNQSQQKKKLTFGTIVKWIFFPFMLVGVIRKSREGKENPV